MAPLLGRLRAAATPERWLRAWRIAIVVLLAWIGVELHLFREEASWGLDFTTMQTLDAIEHNTQKTADEIRRR